MRGKSSNTGSPLDRHYPGIAEARNHRLREPVVTIDGGTTTHEG